VLLSVVSAASAATAPTAARAGDTLTLTGTQQRTAWRDLTRPPLNQRTPSGFTATVGSAVPGTVVIAPVPPKAASDVPVLKPYDFAMVQHKVVIVNPADNKIAEVIAR
jgi:Protein of unknown function (DUF1236)